MNKLAAGTLTEELGRPGDRSNKQQATARHAIYTASTLYKQPEKAVVCYLRAAQLLENDDSPWATQAQRQAIGCAIELIEKYELWNQPLSYKTHRFTVTQSASNIYADATHLDRLYYADRYRSMILTPTIRAQKSGIAMTAHFPKTEKLSPSNPFMPGIGYVYSVTAHPRWIDSNTLHIDLRKSIDHPEDSYNYTIPHTIIEGMTKRFIYEGLVGVFRPYNDLRGSGLYAYEPIDPDRIPIVLVHGLAASPNLWVKPTHKLLQDPFIRENYQFYAFYYPTGLPLAHNASKLKRHVQELHDYLVQHGAGEKAENMVVIGHSMGGLLTSGITRDYSNVASEIYTKDLANVDLGNTSAQALEGLLEEPPLDCVTRAIFVATPHRGSEYANNWIGQITSHFIELPQQFAAIDPNHYREDLTSLGRSIFNPQEGYDGVQRLKFNNPALEYNLSRPKLPQVTYHSIIGDRGFPGQLENSSDGVVSYQSSHLNEAVSEKIVPAWHNAQDNDKAIAEMQRILRLHLKK